MLYVWEMVNQQYGLLTEQNETCRVFLGCQMLHVMYLDSKTSQRMTSNNFYHTF